MNQAHFRFYGKLNFFLPRRYKGVTIEHLFDWRASIKDMIESFGPPHCEIELIVVNGKSVDFNYIVQPDDCIDVYPHSHAVNIFPKIRLRSPLPNPARFILDTHLGRLAAYLRMMGFDTLYRNDYPDEELAQVSHDEARILLTRDSGLLKRNRVIFGYYVRETDPRKRLAEVTERFDLASSVVPFKHCMKCNGLLEAVAKEAVRNVLPPGTINYYDIFHRCQSCDRIFWKGSHYQKMENLMTQVLNGTLKTL